MTSLTVGSVPTDDELSQFLKDGVLDVTNRWLAIRPQDMELFGRETSTSDAQGVSVGGARIIHVIREAGADGTSDGSTAWEPCSQIPTSMQSRAVDKNSLLYASAFNPVYTVNSDKTINVYPVPSANNGFKVFYVNEEPRDISNNANLIYSHSNIKYFPNDKVRLVVIYAAMKTIHAVMSDLQTPTVMPNLSVLTDGPEAPILARVTYNGPDKPDLESIFDISNTVISTTNTQGYNTVTGVIPTYNTTNVKFDINLTAVPSIADISIKAVPPDSLDAPNFVSEGIGTPSDITFGTAPTFTVPTVTGASSLTDLEEGATVGLDSDFDDFGKWFGMAGEFLEDKQDIESAGAQLQKIGSYLSAYSAQIQANLNSFNAENVEYQAEIQKQMAMLNANISRLTQDEANREAMLIQDYQQTLAKFQADLSTYQAEVNTEVQEYQQNYQKIIGLHQQEVNQAVQEHQAKMSDEMNAFNAQNAEYQGVMQTELQRIQAENQIALANMQKDQALAVQNQTQEQALVLTNATQETQAIMQDNQNKIALHQAEMTKYQADVQNALQEYAQNLGKLQAELSVVGQGYQWYQDQYTRLKTEYDQAFQIPGNNQQPQQQERRAR
jgi:hypothetical protein